VLYGVPPQDPVALAVAAGLMLATAAAASLPTALRTVRLDAAQILRDE
jgi:ABC-type lipoprotein release transport system permease subunit